MATHTPLPKPKKIIPSQSIPMFPGVGETGPNMILPNTGFFGEHPGLSNTLENVLLGLAAMPQTSPLAGVGENIQAVAAGLAGIQPARHQFQLQQALFPYQLGAMQLGMEKTEADILAQQAEAAERFSKAEHYWPGVADQRALAAEIGAAGRQKHYLGRDAAGKPTVYLSRPVYDRATGGVRMVDEPQSHISPEDFMRQKAMERRQGRTPLQEEALLAQAGPPPTPSPGESDEAFRQRQAQWGQSILGGLINLRAAPLERVFQTRAEVDYVKRYQDEVTSIIRKGQKVYGIQDFEQARRAARRAGQDAAFRQLYPSPEIWINEMNQQEEDRARQQAESFFEEFLLSGQGGDPETFRRWVGRRIFGARPMPGRPAAAPRPQNPFRRGGASAVPPIPK